MANLLKTGAEFLATQLSLHAADDVTYSRGAASATVAATLGRSEFDVDQGDGSFLHVVTNDFIVRVEDLLIGEPAKGDRITANGEVFEVMPVPGEPAWRYTDEHRYAYRIHTKRVDTA